MCRGIGHLEYMETRGWAVDKVLRGLLKGQKPKRGIPTAYVRLLSDLYHILVILRCTT